VVSTTIHSHYLPSDEINKGTVDLLCRQGDFAADRHFALKRNSVFGGADVRAQHVQILDGAAVGIAGSIYDPTLRKQINLTFWKNKLFNCVLKPIGELVSQANHLHLTSQKFT